MKSTRINSFLNLFTLFTLLALTFSSIGVTPAYAATFTVTKTADTNDGTCGADCSLREAITAANAAAGKDTITLPAGTYTLTLGSQLPAVTSAIIINGSGAANTFIQANASANTATYRVFEVSAGGDLTLNSLTVRNGRCNGSCANYTTSGGGILNVGALTVSNVTFSTNSATYGGGMYNGSSPTLTNVTFSGNSATNYGGGMYNTNSSPILTEVTFSANSAITGGGMYNYSSNLTLTNVTFSGNTATNFGGGIYNFGGNLTLTSVTFSGNSATYGGGMYNYSGSPALTDVTFSGNTAASWGGGMFNDSSSPTLTDVTFSGNTATSYGGGMYNFGGNLTLTNVTFSANSASDGGGMYNESTSPALANVTFSGNSATYGGGGMFNKGSSNPTLANVTFSANSADTGGGMFNNGNSPALTNVTFSANSATIGGGLYNYNSSNPTLKNTIIANSPSGGDCVNNVTSTLNAASSNNLIEDSAYACGLTNGVNGNIIGSDPNLGALTGSPAYFPLNAGSPALDAGDDAICVAAPVNNTSQNGITRPQGIHCDMGSTEKIFLLTGVFRSQGAQDGYVFESTEISSVGGTMNSAATVFYLGDGAANRQYRAILHFGTTSLPDTAVITKATLKIKKQGQVGTNPFTILGGLKVDMRKPYFGTAVGLVIHDFQAAAGKSAVTTFNATPVSNWYSALLNATGRAYVNKTGTTQFRLRFQKDDNDDLGADYMKFFSGDYATASARPTLIIEYYVP